MCRFRVTALEEPRVASATHTTIIQSAFQLLFLRFLELREAPRSRSLRPQSVQHTLFCRLCCCCRRYC